MSLDTHTALLAFANVLVSGRRKVVGEMTKVACRNIWDWGALIDSDGMTRSPSTARRRPSLTGHVKHASTQRVAQTMYHLFKSIYLHATSKEGTTSNSGAWHALRLMNPRILCPPARPRQCRQDYTPRADKRHLHGLAPQSQDCSHRRPKRCYHRPTPSKPTHLPQDMGCRRPT